MAATKEEHQELLGTVLVTGGCGFMGSFITEAFAAEPSCTRLVVASRNPKRFCIPEAAYHSCDFRNADEVNALLDDIQPKTIIHTLLPGTFALASEHYRATYLGTSQSPRTREATSKHPDVNHRPINKAEAKVTDWTSQASPHSRAKGSTETLVPGSNTDATTVDFSEDADWQGKIVTTSLRVTGLYGQRDKTTIKEMLGLVNTFATRIQIGPNKLVHPWCYVDSAANAHVHAAKSLLHGKHLQPDMRVDGGAFFIADPEPIKFWDFTRNVQKAAGDKFCSRPKGLQKPIVLPFWVMMTVAWISEWVYWIFTLGTKRPRMTLDHFEFVARGCWFSIEKARTRLAWEPVCDTEEGIRRSVKWFHENADWEKQM